MFTRDQLHKAGLAAGMVLSTMTGTAAAQGALEEIVVTAQRREQSLQEVPISIDAVSGEEIRQQGFRNMDQLADFSPSILIDTRIQDQDIAIRGVGTTGNNLTLEQAAPTFVDGIHYGRTSQIKNAFLDIERVEVLRGPQPVYFGQNATAGAFSITTRKPGPEWEGDVNAEIGNFGRRTVEGGIGGPVTDTLGVRFAGKWDKSDGYLTDVISGQDFPEGRDYAGRVLLQWTPTDNFEATAKFQMTDYDGGSDATAVALSGSGHPGPIERSVLIDGFDGFDLIPLTGSLEDGLGVRTGQRFFAPIDEINQEDADSGNVDIRSMFCELSLQFQKGTGKCGGYESINPWDTYLNLSYTLDNGIELSSLTGYSHLSRSYNRDNSLSPFIMNVQHREEDYASTSQEFRVSSPSGGTFEWMAGAYWQKTDLELRSDSIRGNVRRARRFNDATEEAEWLSGFATLTFNFMDNRASIDVGGRYTDVTKNTAVTGYSANWIFDVEPVSCNTDPDLECDSYVAVDGGWTVPFNEIRNVPPEWDTQAPTGITPLVAAFREGGPFSGEFNEDDFNPQITLRFRPTDSISTYARWAQAFKAGGFDTGSSSLPETQDEFEFDSEYAENWEIGAKGTFWEGRARANASLFWMEVEDMQIATTAIDPDGLTSQGSFSTNAGLQRVRGLEFDATALVADRLTLGINGALMDGEMVEYEGAGCTDAELATADTGPCISEEESAELTGIPIGDDDSDAFEGLIDRSGSEAPRTPDWIFTANVDYWIPLMDGYKATFNGKFKYSDGYITNVEDFALDIKMNTHADMNLSVGFGDINDTWRLSLWGRNLLEPLPSYNAEFDVEPNGLITSGLSSSHFRSYGLQFEFNYR